MTPSQGFARAADARGVDIIQNCEVRVFVVKGRFVEVEQAEDTSAPRKWPLWLQVMLAFWRIWRTAFQSKAIHCRRWCLSP